MVIDASGDSAPMNEDGPGRDYGYLPEGVYRAVLVMTTTEGKASAPVGTGFEPTCI